MANTLSAKKRARQTIRRTLRNMGVRNSVKTAINRARAALTVPNTKEAAKNATAVTKEVADSLVKTAVSTIAKASNKGILHKKAAARRISRLMKKAANLADNISETVAAAAPKAKASKSTKTKSATRKNA